jgi:Tol biopolymer transport system component
MRLPLARHAAPLFASAIAAVLLVLSPPALAAGPGSTVLVSRPDGLGPVPPAFDNRSGTGVNAVSADGRYAVFTSAADGFAPGVDPHVTNVFLRDTTTATTTLVSRSDGPGGAGANADSEAPDVAVGPNGHVYVTFETGATNLSDHATGPVTAANQSTEVWLRDVTAGTTTLVSRVGTGGAPADSDARKASLGAGAGGPVVAFESRAPNLGATGSSGVFLRTVDARATELVSCHLLDCSTARPLGGDSNSPDVREVPAAAGTPCLPAQRPSGACVIVAFDTIDSTIGGSVKRQVVLAVATAPATPGAATAPPNAFIVASSKTDGTRGNEFSENASLSSDGRAVGFISSATNLTADTFPANAPQAFVWRSDSGATQLVSKANAPADRGAGSIALGGDLGRLRAVFDSTATNLGGGPQSRFYLRDLATSTTSLADRAAGEGGAPGDGQGAGVPAISADGSAIVFASTSRNLGDAPSDRFTHVHLRRLDDPAQPVELVSRPSGSGPLPDGTGPSFLPSQAATSADGRYVVFGSVGNTLSAGDEGRFEEVYVRDQLTGHTALVSRADGAAGARANDNAIPSGISADGRMVVFDSPATNLGADATSGVGSVYVRNLDTDTTTLVSRADGAGGAPAALRAFAGPISADGHVVVFETKSPLDPAAADGQQHVYVRDLARQTTTLVDRDSGVAGTVPAAGGFEPAVDADGSRVAWDSSAVIAGAPADGRIHVFVRDLGTHETQLVSRVDGADGARDRRGRRPGGVRVGRAEPRGHECQHAGVPARRRGRAHRAREPEP